MPSGIRAPTAMTPGYAAGYSGLPVGSFPAAATAIIPLDIAKARAFCMNWLLTSDPQLRLRTRAPLSTAKLMLRSMPYVVA